MTKCGSCHPCERATGVLVLLAAGTRRYAAQPMSPERWGWGHIDAIDHAARARPAGFKE